MCNRTLHALTILERKRLTIGVELAARPKLLLFLDEPTSGLDSQTSWSICDLMEKLTRNGQAILCTVHQPSSLLFQRFDRLLLLAKGGRTVYFGDVGRNSKVLLDYFARNGASQCPAGTNPAEYMLEAIGAAPGAHTLIAWPAVWKESAEYASVQDELARLRDLVSQPSAVIDSEGTHQEFAAPFTTQFRAVALRCAQQYWRTPSYIYSKAVLTVGCSLLIGFSFFKGENSMQGLQNQMFGVFVFLFVVIQLIYQIMPLFVTQRTMYEARERQSKTYAWQAFVLSNIAIEMAWNVVSYTESSTILPLMIVVHGYLLLPGLVLSGRPLPQRRMDGFCSHPCVPHASHYCGHLPLLQFTGPLVDCRCTKRRNCGRFRNAALHHALCVQWYPSRPRYIATILDLHVSRKLSCIRSKNLSNIIRSIPSHTLSPASWPQRLAKHPPTAMNPSTKDSLHHQINPAPSTCATTFRKLVAFCATRKLPANANTAKWTIRTSF
jgi:energy-coupling factor transporter ATP-binding protein EcfA2